MYSMGFCSSSSYSGSLCEVIFFTEMSGYFTCVLGLTMALWMSHLIDTFPCSREEASVRGHMWWASFSAREQGRDNPCRALQTVTTKKWATAGLDVLVLKQLIPAGSPEEFSASFPFLGPTSSVVLVSGADALGTARSLSSFPLEFANLLTLSVFILGVISSHFEALRYSWLCWCIVVTLLSPSA